MEQDIPVLVRNAAKDMYELLMQLALHVEKIEAENKRLKEENERNDRGSETWDN